MTGDFVFRSSRILLAFNASFGLGGPIVVAIVATVNPPDPADWLAPWCLGIFCLLLGGTGSVFANESVRISAERITKFGPFFRQRTVAWGDIMAVTFDPYGGITLLAASGARVHVTADMSGIADFPNLLEQYLPEQVRRECEENLARYRRFLGV
jgi:hypothetical protein